DLVLLRDVRADEDVPDARLADGPDARVHLLLGLVRLVAAAEVVDRDVGAALGEANGDRLADPRGAAGDEDVLALEAVRPLALDGRFGHRHLGPPWSCCSLRMGLGRRAGGTPGSAGAAQDGAGLAAPA